MGEKESEKVVQPVDCEIQGYEGMRDNQNQRMDWIYGDGDGKMVI